MHYIVNECLEAGSVEHKFRSLIGQWPRAPRKVHTDSPHWLLWGTQRVRADKCISCNELHETGGGEAGIRTLGRGLCPFNGLANRRLQPLGHLTASTTREPAGTGRNTDYTPMSAVVRPPRQPSAARPRAVTRSPRGPPAAPTGTRAGPPP